MTQVIRKLVEIDAGQQVVQSLGTHPGNKFIGIALIEVLVFGRNSFHDVEIFLLGKKVEIGYAVVGFDAGVDHHITLVINNGVEFFGLQSEQCSNFVGQRTEEPDMCYGNHQLNMSGAFASNLFLSNFHAAAVANDALVTDSFVFSAMALPVFYRPENPFAKQAVAFGLVSTIVDRFGLEHFAMRALEYRLRGGQANSYL